MYLLSNSCNTSMAICRWLAIARFHVKISIFDTFVDIPLNVFESEHSCSGSYFVFAIAHEKSKCIEQKKNELGKGNESFDLDPLYYSPTQYNKTPIALLWVHDALKTILGFFLNGQDDLLHQQQWPLQQPLRPNRPDDKQPLPQTKAKNSRKFSWLATIMVAAASAMFTARNFTVKAKSLNNLDVLLIQSLLMAVVLAGLAKAKGLKLWPSAKIDDLPKIRFGLLIAGMAGNLNYLYEKIK